MVFDRLIQAPRYYGLSVLIARGLTYLRETDLDALDEGRHEIDGAALYVTVIDGQSAPNAQGFWEAHRRYIDIQYLQRGEDRMGYSPLSRLEAGEYDESRDLVRASGQGTFLDMSAGDFAIFWPEDAHMPGIAPDRPAPVRRIVVKVAVGTQV
ncbi:MAG TPA: YhcH/YjgK/YiaL family protein [Vicinamibacterales bacterium]|jgi:YhcH/YjgK/YiaL family protein